MSEDIARIKFVKKMIDSIGVIVNRHGGLSAALADEEEAQKALLMCLQQIGESLNKIKDPGIRGAFDPDDIKGAYDVRMFIAHDYMGVNMAIIERILREKIPVIKETVCTLLDC
ncbi:MAG TPA: DUF86 domain-containing protein [Desulfuromonadales bacterium]|nr:DUF86 domain-containing protein [Desulfuromonadales bacterium]